MSGGYGGVRRREEMKKCVDCRKVWKRELLVGGRRCMECFEKWLCDHNLTWEDLVECGIVGWRGGER